MKTKTSSYPLRLPVSLKAAVSKMSKEEGSSINQFVVMAVAEKVAALNAAHFLAERAKGADLDAFDRFMTRKTGAKPAVEDQLE